ncbi:pectate lyase family protein [Planosporangium sp. 12N6]|uniref:pectate lyase family protein n=1 Tax=Planosporangium spinosum TaxID=3402278 RepID=UPI003CFB9636
MRLALTGALVASVVAAAPLTAATPTSAGAPSSTSDAAATALARLLPAAAGRSAVGGWATTADGWAAESGGTSGGASAGPDQISVVRDRAGLVRALGGDNATNGANATPKIIVVAGTIDGNVDDAGRTLTCADYADPAYSLPAYLTAYDPATWGTSAVPAGPLEDARVRSAGNQGRRVKITVGSNTTIVGVGPHARILGANLVLDKVDNVVIRNLTFEDAHDCFPSWDPTDGATGNWNSLYDNVSLTGATHVWIDHNTFTDGANPDSGQPLHFGRPYQVHDGELDITKASDLVTVSYNHLRDHDKTMLIGSSDKPGNDVGRLRVTIHHNRFTDLGQRAPRVRYGQVHVYDNLYEVPSGADYGYSWGVGVQSHIYAENNYFQLAADVAPDRLVKDWGGTALFETGTVVRTGRGHPTPMSLRDAYNATHDPDLAGDAGWTPTQPGPVEPAVAAAERVRGSAGARPLGGDH